MRLGYVLPDLLDVRHTAYSLNGNWSTPTPSVGQFFSIFILVIAVAVLAYFTTRLVGSVRYGRFGKRNLEIIESMGVGAQSFVHILRVGEQYILIAVTRGQINILTKLEAEQLKLSESDQPSTFESLMSRFQKKEDPPEN